MLQVQNIKMQYGSRVLFSNVSFSIKNQDRIGLAGRNGAGKTTLLKIIASLEKAETGQIVKPQTYTMGYLSQNVNRMSGCSLYDEVSKAFGNLLELEKDIGNLEHELSVREDYHTEEYLQLASNLDDKQHRLDHLGAADKDKRIEQVLTGLGFEREDLPRQVEHFSGGWQMRIALAKLLLENPDLILLDEPTNHLDIESLQWLEGFLKSYSGALLVISHDVAFLDNVTGRTIELSMGKLYDYKASYSKYLMMRQERREKQRSEKKNQDKHIAHTKELINKFRAKKNKAKFAQTLISKLDRLEIVEVDDEDTSGIRFHFPEAPRSGKVVVKADGLSKSYGDLEVLRNINFEILKGEKIAFVGKNGEGKSTLSRIIEGMESHTGKMQIGYNVEIGFFAQNQAEQLDGDDTVFKVIDDAATGDMRSRVRGLLGAFLFSGDDVDKKVKVLSGGEKSRLALAHLLLEPINLLILDEPTNHLDVRSKEVLKTALQNFDGSMIIVSHDRDFLKGLTDRVFEFKGGGITEFAGDIYDYLDAKNLKNLNELERTNPGAVKIKNKVSDLDGHSGELTNKARYLAKKTAEKEARKLKSRVKNLEKAIEKSEVDLELIEQKLKNPEFYKSLSPTDKIFAEYEALKEKLKQQMEEWEKAAGQLDVN